ARFTHGYALPPLCGSYQTAYPVGFARARGARFTHGYTLAAAYAAHIKLLIPWVSLAPEALASPTAILLPPLTRLISIGEALQRLLLGKSLLHLFH
ncbi:MAG: hypothetical protein IKP00_05655, partial [Victivallales bacterium]|nr:hypothetical protein [Victivallales bacterium]